MNQENITRTLATGQSDITRHEAHTKAQGLNWSNANAPKYSAGSTHEYVDLGLPSGTLWATMNVGANSETDYGLYFAWGETEGYTASQIPSKKKFYWDDYKFGSPSPFSKYGNDGLTKLELTDDAASVNMGGDWHMPTVEQFVELFNTDYVTNAWVTDYQGSGISGRLFTSVNNGNTLFIPAAGFCHEGEVDGVGGCGNVWSSSLSTYDVGTAWYFSFDNNEAGVNDIGGGRFLGRSVRGVIGNIDK